MTTKASARRALLAALGGGAVYGTTGAGSTSTLVAAGFKSTLLPATHLDGAWINVATAVTPTQRRVRPNGLDPLTGTITVDDVFGSSIGLGVLFELSTLLPPALDNGVATAHLSLEECVMEALRHLLIADEITIPATPGLADLDLTTWASWLDRDERLVGVLEPSPVAVGALIASDWREPRLIRDGQTVKLRLSVPFSGGTGVLTLGVLRPADTWLRIGGVWTEAGPGTTMLAETDECKPDLRHIREAGLVFAYRALAAARSGPRRAEYQARYEQQLATARALPMWDSSRDSLMPPPLEARGGRQSSGSGVEAAA